MPDLPPRQLRMLGLVGDALGAKIASDLGNPSRAIEHLDELTREIPELRIELAAEVERRRTARERERARRG